MTKQARKLHADLPTITALDGTELAVVELAGRKYRVPIINIGGLPREGNWAPTLTDLTNSATLSVALGTWERVGRQVTARARLQVSSLGSVSGDMFIGGLPFDIGSGSSFVGSLVVGLAVGMNITAGQSVTGRFASFVNANHIELRLWSATSGMSRLQASELSASTQMYFSITYPTEEA